MVSLMTKWQLFSAFGDVPWLYNKRDYWTNLGESLPAHFHPEINYTFEVICVAVTMRNILEVSCTLLHSLWRSTMAWGDLPPKSEKALAWDRVGVNNSLVPLGSLLKLNSYTQPISLACFSNHSLGAANHVNIHFKFWRDFSPEAPVVFMRANWLVFLRQCNPQKQYERKLPFRVSILKPVTSSSKSCCTVSFVLYSPKFVGCWSEVRRLSSVPTEESIHQGTQRSFKNGLRQIGMGEVSLNSTSHHRLQRIHSVV